MLREMVECCSQSVALFAKWSTRETQLLLIPLDGTVSRTPPKSPQRCDEHVTNTAFTGAMMQVGPCIEVTSGVNWTNETDLTTASVLATVARGLQRRSSGRNWRTCTKTRHGPRRASPIRSLDFSTSSFSTHSTRLRPPRQTTAPGYSADITNCHVTRGLRRHAPDTTPSATCASELVTTS